MKNMKEDIKFQVLIVHILNNYIIFTKNRRGMVKTREEENGNLFPLSLCAPIADHAEDTCRAFVSGCKRFFFSNRGMFG